MSVQAAAPSAVAARPARADSPRADVWRAFRRRRLAVSALTVFAVIVAAALLAPLIGLGHPNHLALRDRLQGPSWSNPLGTDEVGRDELARILAATRISLLATLEATAVGIVLGVPAGLLTGYLGGRVDAVVSRVYDALQSIPPLILAISVVAILGRDLTPAMVAIGVVFSPTFYRVTRAAARTIAGETYVEASRSMGHGTPRIVVTHVLANVSSPIIVQVSTTMAFGILAEAALSYLGLGVQPPDASLGSMLTGAANLINGSPQLTLEPGAVIIVLVLCISLVGDALRDITSLQAGA